MFVVSTRVDGFTFFVGADKRNGRARLWENVADAKRYATLQGARSAARNVGGSVMTLRDARTVMYLSMSMRALKLGLYHDSNVLLDLAIAS